MYVKTLILGFCVTFVNSDTGSTIKDAIDLYYYGQNFNISTIKLNTNISTKYKSYGWVYAFYLPDIIGKAENVSKLTACLSGCLNIKECVAFNYVANLKQCFVSRSGATHASQLFSNHDLAQSYHYVLTSAQSR